MAKQNSEVNMGGQEIRKERIVFRSDTSSCTGYIYSNKEMSGKNPPVLIMGHGIAALQCFGLPAFAEHFVHNGIKVFTFDYRHYGESEGEPRYLISWRKQIADWENAVGFVKSNMNVGEDKIAIWGVSFSGGHVMMTAANHRFAGVIANVPTLDTMALSREFGLSTSLFLARSGFRDLLRMLTFREPYSVPVISSVGGQALLNKEGNYDGYMSMVDPDSGWPNEIVARSIFSLPSYNPKDKLKKVKSPVLIIAGEKDNLVPIKTLEKAVSLLETSVELKRYSCDHFGFYEGEIFEKVMDAQIKFLKKVFNL